MSGGTLALLLLPRLPCPPPTFSLPFSSSNRLMASCALCRSPSRVESLCESCMALQGGVRG